MPNAAVPESNRASSGFETFTIPPYQLVGLPGFEPFEQVPGYEVLGYLVDTYRVGVWTRDDAIVFSLEELDAPFPLYMPAAATTGATRPQRPRRVTR